MWISNCTFLMPVRKRSPDISGRGEPISGSGDCVPNNYHETKTIDVELFTWEKLDRVDDIRKEFGI